MRFLKALPVFFLAACAGDAPNKSQTQPDSLVSTNSPAVADKPLQLDGDFDGDGVWELLTLEISDAQTGARLSTGQVQNLLQQDLDWRGKGRLVCSNGKIAPLVFPEEFMGLIALMNEGDLDGDKGQEISLVRDWSTSSIRDLEVYSYRQGAWSQRAALMINIGFIDGKQLDYERLLQPGKGIGTALAYEYDAAEGEHVRKSIVLSK